MCYPENDALYTDFLEKLGTYQQEITDLLCLQRDIHDRYSCIHRYDKNGTFVLVYLSSFSKQVVKIVVNYNADRNLPVISVFAEDPIIQSTLTDSVVYASIHDLLTQIKTNVEQDRVYVKLKYNI